MDYRSRTLIDQTLELIDPTPSIYTLFVQFNERFFWNTLLPVEVKWSNRMTSCAGTCSYHPRNKQCVITLSAPLLKLRPRKDLVETLLHEMIHGYLFLTNDNRDRDGHGPEFCKHMHRINNEAGTTITIYHDFHDEVRLYKQHWWRCEGPCQRKAPYFGTVRRAMNRAPGPSDFWWKEHQQTCGGQFIKIKEPEKFNIKNTKSNSKLKLIKKDITNDKNILGWLVPKDSTSIGDSFKVVATSVNFSSNGAIKKNAEPGKGRSFTVPNPVGKGLHKLPSVNSSSDFENIINNGAAARGNASVNKVAQQTGNTGLHSKAASPGMKKLGSSANNVYGWAIAGPNTKGDCRNSFNGTTTSTPRFSFSASLGGANFGQTNLLDKFCCDNKKFDKLIKIGSASPERLNNSENTSRAYKNIDSEKKIHSSDQDNFDLISCPVCDIYIHRESINKHLDKCLQENDKVNNKFIDNDESIAEAFTATVQQPSIVEKRKGPITMLPTKRAKVHELEQLKCASCPICSKQVQLTEMNEHLDNCLLSDKDDDNTTKPFNNHFDQKDKCTTHQCLVCNSIITAGTSLNDHLEECVGSVFNDSGDMCDIIEEKSVNSVKYPCPACMELHSDEFMNEHLDKCLMAQ